MTNRKNEENEVSFEDMCDALTLESEKDDDYTQVEYELPPFERKVCSSHTEFGGQFRFWEKLVFFISVQR